eukprot:790004-Pyramimonas_sp.AAC.4
MSTHEHINTCARQHISINTSQSARVWTTEARVWTIEARVWTIEARVSLLEPGSQANEKEGKGKALRGVESAPLQLLAQKDP